MAQLPTTNISTTLVRNTLGEDNNDVGLLCLSNNINIWAKYKPHSLSEPSGVESDGYRDHGLYRSSDTKAITYARPAGGASDPYRLGDFRQYNHSAKPPVQFNFTKVVEINTNQVLTAPYRFIIGFKYEFTFNILLGDILPSEIHSKTVETKNTDAWGGYGGISLFSGLNAHAIQERASSQVFSGGSINNKITLICEGAGFNGFHFDYCYFDGDDTYQNLGWKMEYQGYRDDFNEGYIDFDSTIGSFWWDSLAGLPRCKLSIVNNTGRSFTSFRVTYQWTSTGSNSSGTVNPVNVAATGTTTVDLTLAVGGNNGTTTYSVAAQVQVFDSVTSTWTTINQVNPTIGNITIPNY